jgi:hypothetical protein
MLLSNFNIIYLIIISLVCLFVFVKFVYDDVKGNCHGGSLKLFFYDGGFKRSLFYLTVSVSLFFFFSLPVLFSLYMHFLKEGIFFLLFITAYVWSHL